MKQHDDDAAPPPLSPRPRRKPAAPQARVWPFPAAAFAPPPRGSKSNAEVDPVRATAQPLVVEAGAAGTIDPTTTRTISPGRKP